MRIPPLSILRIWQGFPSHLMMKIEKHLTTSCCGKTNLTFTLDKPISKTLLEVLVKNSYKELPNFTKSGILYVETTQIVVSGVFGKNVLQVKCKKKECQNSIISLEQILIAS